ncbi:hypothetical protein F4780DRAFT_774314 [Xylariomycetidae sp. FL0641]|nr:hypothetical protein F4780DRAFT_774314 [Xylariomycetidae sp. FL0641]
MQGFNMGRYVPPDVEGTVTSGNALHKKSKPSPRGTQTVRFEMPFAVWCGHCPKPTLIGQGVRFNAAKTRTGWYHSSAVWTFTMRHAACGGELAIRTDPARTAYVVVAGGRKRDDGTDRLLAEEEEEEGAGGASPALLTGRERDDLRRDAFARLETTIADRAAAAAAAHRLDHLAGASEARWADPYARNAALRRAFRAGRHERERAAAAAADLRDRMSLGIELAPEHAADARRAALADFGPRVSPSDPDRSGEEALARPLFPADKAEPAPDSPKPKPKQPQQPQRLKAERAAARTREALASSVRGRARAAQDPFLASAFPSSSSSSSSSSSANKNNHHHHAADGPSSSSSVSGTGNKAHAPAHGPARIPGIKRKRAEAEPGDDDPEPAGHAEEPEAEAEAEAEAQADNEAKEKGKEKKTMPAKTHAPTTALVAYDDSD